MTVPVAIASAAAVAQQKISKPHQRNVKRRCSTLTCQMLPLTVSFAILTLDVSVLTKTTQYVMDSSVISGNVTGAGFTKFLPVKAILT